MNARIILRTGVALVLLTCTTFADDAPRTAAERVERGDKLRKDNKLEEAAEAYNSAVKLDDKNVKAYLGLAYLRLYQREWSKALDVCEEAVKLDPKSAEPLAVRAAILLGKNEEDDKGSELDKISTDIEKALKLDPKSAFTHAVRAVYFNAKEKYDLALASIDDALALDPKLPGPYITRALVHARKGEWDKSIENCNKAIELDPYAYQAFNNRSWMYIEKGDKEKCIEDATKSLELCPRNFWAHNNRASGYRDKGEISKALDELQASMKLAPNKSVTYNLTAGIYNRQKDYTRAIEYANKAIECNPKNPFAWHNRGISYSWRADYSQAVRDYSEAIRLKPDYAFAYKNRALSLQSLGRRAEAASDQANFEKFYKAPADVEIPKGKTLSDTACGFTIWMPADWQKQERTVAVDFGNVKVVVYGVIEAGSGYAVQGYLGKYPRNPNIKDSDRFANAREGEIAQTKGKLESEKEITLGAYPGRESMISVPGIGWLRTRIYLANQKVYVLKVLGPKPFVTSKVAEKFFESFKVID